MARQGLVRGRRVQETGERLGLVGGVRVQETSPSGPSATLSGTVYPTVTESNIKAGGYTITINITGDTLIE